MIRTYLLMTAAFTIGWLLCAAMSEVRQGWLDSRARRRRDPYTGMSL